MRIRSCLYLGAVSLLIFHRDIKIESNANALESSHGTVEEFSLLIISPVMQTTFLITDLLPHYDRNETT